MLQLEHKRRLVEACYPESKEEARELWANIQPVKFGNRLQWITSANAQTLASYQIPPSAAYLAILRVECYTTTFVAAAPAFGQHSPPPPGDVQWFNGAVTAINAVSGLVPIHLLADVDEAIFVPGGMTVSLAGVLGAIPDANARFIRTTVYAYLLGGPVRDRLGNIESFAIGSDT